MITLIRYLSIGSVEKLNSERARFELVLQPLEPSQHYFYIADPIIMVAPYDHFYSFIGRENFEGAINPPPEALVDYEAYLFDTERISKFSGGFEVIKDIVRKTKMAGVRVFYRVGNVYMR